MVRVTSTSSPQTIATRLLAAISEEGAATAQAIGAAAVNQALKAVAILCQESGRNYAAYPDFAELIGDDGRTLSCLCILVRSTI